MQNLQNLEITVVHYMVTSKIEEFKHMLCKIPFYYPAITQPSGVKYNTMNACTRDGLHPVFQAFFEGKPTILVIFNIT